MSILNIREKKIEGLTFLRSLAHYHSDTLQGRLHDVCLSLIQEVYNTPWSFSPLYTLLLRSESDSNCWLLRFHVLMMSVLLRWRTCVQGCPGLQYVHWATCTPNCRRRWTRSWRGQLKLCCRRPGRVMPSSGRMWMQHWTAWCSTAHPLVVSVLYCLGDSGQYVWAHRVYTCARGVNLWALWHYSSHQIYIFFILIFNNVSPLLIVTLMLLWENAPPSICQIWWRRLAQSVFSPAGKISQTESCLPSPNLHKTPHRKPGVWRHLFIWLHVSRVRCLLYVCHTDQTQNLLWDFAVAQHVCSV